MATVGTSGILTIREVIRTRIRDVRNWLLDKQLPDGSWKGSPWHTSKIVMALVDNGVDPEHEKIRAAYDYLIQSKEETEDGLINWEGWTWDTALVIRALCRLRTPERDKYISRALKWIKREERTSIEAPVIATYFGRCYTAQTVLAMLEAGDNDKQSLDFFVTSLKSLQERDGGWINSFDTAQIVEALVRAKAPRKWQVESDGGAFEGGLDLAVQWIETKQSRYGNWDGITWPTAWTLRAYLLAAETYDPAIVNLAVSWLLEQKAAHNPSWFHEQGRTASAIITLKVVLDTLDRHRVPNLDLGMRHTVWTASYTELSKGRKAIERTELAQTIELREIIHQLNSQLRQTKLKYSRLRLITAALVVGLLAGLGYILQYQLGSYILAVISVILGVIALILPRIREE